MHSGSDGEAITFIETSAILNYVKVEAFSQLYVKPPSRAVEIAYFIKNAIKEKYRMHTSRRVIEQLKYKREMFERELKGKGLPSATIAKIVQIATRATQELLDNSVVISEVDGAEHVEKVRNFFEQYTEDQRLLGVAEAKEAKEGVKNKPMPEESDMKIFSDAIKLSSKYFVTTDHHFCVLDFELKKAFQIEIINHFNARIKAQQLFPN